MAFRPDKSGRNFYKVKLLSNIPSILKNKFLIAGALFIVWMFFFDPKDIHSDISRSDKLKDLQKNEQRLTSEILATQEELKQLKTNAQTIEKYAREKYLMKKDNEDLFIISNADIQK
jgi:cell division protein DivIC